MLRNSTLIHTQRRESWGDCMNAASPQNTHFYSPMKSRWFIMHCTEFQYYFLADHPCHPINWILAMWCMAVWRHAKLLSQMWDRALFHSTPPTNIWTGQDSLSTWWPKSGLFLMTRAWSLVSDLTQLQSSALKDRFKHYYLSMWESVHVLCICALT